MSDSPPEKKEETKNQTKVDPLLEKYKVFL